MNEKLLNQIYFNSVANQNCKDFLISNSSRSSKKFSNSTSEILEITFQIFKNKLKCTEEKRRMNEKVMLWKEHRRIPLTRKIQSCLCDLWQNIISIPQVKWVVSISFIRDMVSTLPKSSQLSLLTIGDLNGLGGGGVGRMDWSNPMTYKILDWKIHNASRELK